VVIGALAPAIPEAAVGAANGANTTAVFFGHDPRHDRDYVYLETLGGGFGGRFTKDGKDGVQVHITNTSNLPVESIEMEYPLLVESYGFVADSGGAGKHRGGLGLRRVVRPVGHTMTFSGQGERFVNKPLPREEFDEVFAQVERWGLDQYLKDRSPETLSYST